MYVLLDSLHKMVTSYYIMKMSARKEMDIAHYYSNVSETPCNSNVNKCRICLREGSVPIYGNRESPGLPEALVAFADVVISEQDQYPQHLCKVCHKFLKGAILFRKTAQLTDQMLRKPVKLEAADTSLNVEHQYECEIQPNETRSNFQSVDKDKKVALDNTSEGTVQWDNKRFAGIKPVVECKKLPAKVNCKICKKLICRKYYKYHLTMHDPNHEKKHVCEVCGKKFRLECAYLNHRNVHRTDFPHKCQFCPYRAQYGHLLRTHLRTHSSEFKYMCNECPKRFRFRSNMNAHILKMHRVRQHKCETCKRSFHTIKEMQKHFEADHMGVKNHICDLCGKAFGYRNAMMKHQRGVHKREKMAFGRMPTYLRFETELQNVDIEELQ